MMENYIYYNPNPTAKYKKDGTPYRWDKGDCTTRAICAATGLSWEEAYNMQCEEGMKQYRIPNEPPVVGKVLESLGYEKKSVKVSRGESRPTPSTIAKEYVGYCGVVQVSNHMVGFNDGLYMDVWDSGYKGVYTYWIKKL